MSGKNKSTHAIVEERVLFILPLTSMMNRREILQYIRNKKSWKVSTKQIDNYIFKARDLMKDQLEETKTRAIEKAYNNLMLLLKKAFAVKDYKTCLSVQKEINELFGLKSAQKIDLTTNGESLNINKSMTAEEASKLYAQALKKND